MRLSVFGASGRIGSYLVRFARERGHEMTVFFRKDSHSLPPFGATVVWGDLRNPGDIERAVTGADAVICLYSGRPPRPHVFSAATAASVVDAMKALGVKRLINVENSWFSGGPGSDLLVRVMGAVSLLPYPDTARDRATQRELIEASGIDWTIIESPRLTGKTRSKDYRIGPDLRVTLSACITREALAAAVLDQAESDRFVRQRVVVRDQKRGRERVSSTSSDQ